MLKIATVTQKKVYLADNGPCGNIRSTGGLLEFIEFRGHCQQVNRAELQLRSISLKWPGLKYSFWLKEDRLPRQYELDAIDRLAPRPLRQTPEHPALCRFTRKPAPAESTCDQIPKPNSLEKRLGPCRELPTNFTAEEIELPSTCARLRARQCRSIWNRDSVETSQQR